MGQGCADGVRAHLAPGKYQSRDEEFAVRPGLCDPQVQDRVHEPGQGVVSFFSSRRAPSGPFHLLQNMYLKRLWGKRRRASRIHDPDNAPSEFADD